MPRPAASRARRRRRRRPHLPIFAAAGMFTTSAAMSLAGHVPIGGFDVVPEGDTSDTQALVGELLGERTVPFTIEDFTTGQTLISGTVSQRMIREAEKQSITFHYLVTGTPSQSADSLIRLSAFSFGEFVHTDVNYLMDDAALGKPTRVGRTDNAIDANFDGADGSLAQGNAISFFVRTNATIFDETGFVALDALAPEPDPETGSAVRSGVAEGLFRAVVPTAVPLPAAVYTGILGLSTVVWAKRRMKR